MRIDGIELREGSKITNLQVASGTAFPDSPGDGETFYRNDVDNDISGLYVYRHGGWHRINTAETTTLPNSASLPTTTLPGMIYYLNSGDTTEGLYYYDSETGWNFFADTNVTVAIADDHAIAMAIALG